MKIAITPVAKSDSHISGDCPGLGPVTDRAMAAAPDIELDMGLDTELEMEKEEIFI